MIEIELFYKIVEASIRENHTAYLESQKRAIVPVVLPKVDDLPTGDDWKKLSIFERVRLKSVRRKQLKAYKKAVKKQREVRVEDKLLKGFNSGVKMALKVLSAEYARYDKRIEKELQKDMPSDKY